MPSISPNFRTKFHSDVLGSFSWSVNIFGRKQWYLLRPSTERFFNTGNGYYMEDIRQRRDLWAQAGVMEFVQQPGEIVFIPSGWYHQVHNLETSLSLNHNVINACNADYLLRLVRERLVDVRRELADVEAICSVEEFQATCQRLLFADCRMNVPKLVEFMDMVIESRQLNAPSSEYLNQFLSKHGHVSVYDLRDCHPCLEKLRQTLVSRCTCSDDPAQKQLCSSCGRFQSQLDLQCALGVRREASLLDDAVKTMLESGSAGDGSSGL